MLETVGEPLREPGGAFRVPGAHGRADREQLGGEARRELFATPAHEGVEAADGPVQALHGRGERPAANPCFGEIDDLSHGSHHEPPV